MTMIPCAEPKNTSNTTTIIPTTMSFIQDDQCPLLFYYDSENNRCECLSSAFTTLEGIVVCANDNRGQLGFNFCMTYDKETNTVSASFCTYFALDGHNISEPGFISLPGNISKLNDYICGPMNRKGLVCSECISGYGPSVNSPKFRCSDCSNAWYGVPLYLLLELVPVTVFYLIVLIFQINLTSAPMPSFIFYSNMILIALNFNVTNQDQVESQVLGTIHALSYGIWTLDFFRFVVPPFCVSPNLKIIHAFYLQNISTIFPFVLIAITWLCIKLHSRDYRVVTWPWLLLNRVIFKHLNMKWNSGRSIVDAFATFFLLAFSKITLMLLLPLYPLRVQNLNYTDLSSSITVHSFTDPSVKFVSKEHLPYAAVSVVVFLLAVLSPVVLLALYPFQCFRSLLVRFLPKRLVCPLNIFVEKFYSCYRDGLGGGRDMRSLASLYFCIVLFGFFLWSVESTFFLVAIFFGGCGLFIANIRPYKKKYMSTIDSLILANMALLSAALESDRNVYASHFFQIIIGVLVLLPALGLLGFVMYKLFKKPLKRVFVKIKEKLPQVKLQWCCSGRKDDGVRDEEQGNADNGCDDEVQLPDRIVHPELYTLEEDQTLA